MCGIAGTYLWPDGGRHRPAHRGARPPRPGRRRAGTRHSAGDGEVHLGHRRLSIVDLSETGAQPMVVDGLALTYNGELYNAPELRAELAAAGVRFRGTSDTEVLLRGVAALGHRTACPGCAACSRSRSSTSAPVSWCSPATSSASSRCSWSGAAAGWCSPPSSRRWPPRSGGSLQVDEAALVASLLYYWVPDSRCAFREAEKLPPGSWLRCRPDGRVRARPRTGR